MATTVMKFSREEGNYATYTTDKVGDNLGFATTQDPSFPANTIATSVSFYIEQGLKSGSGSARNSPFGIEFKSNGNWHSVWTGEKFLSGTGGDGTVPAFDIAIPSECQRIFAQYGVTKVRILQTDKDYAIKGTDDAYGTATFTYSNYYTRCTAPTSVTVGATSTMSDKVSLSWEGATPGINTTIHGYHVYVSDSLDKKTWTTWTLVGETYKTSPQDVPTPEVGYYRKYRVHTLAAVDGKYNSAYNPTSAKEADQPVLRLKTVTRVTAPTSVTVASEITAAATNVLSWDGADDGTNNTISGYFIQYADSSDNSQWSAWAELKTVGTETSTDVDMPAENTYRKYKVWTLGNAGVDWRSDTGQESVAVYRGHAELDGFTDSPLVVGETFVKALHMQELQNRVNTLRNFYRMSAYSFTQITSGVTGLKDWTAHVNEIRAAIDEISTAHDKWIEFSVNCPRADVIEQLRAVILAL